MAKQDRGEHFVFQHRGEHFVLQDIRVTETGQAYTLENLPDEFRKMLPPELINRIRQGTFETPGLSALQKDDPAFDAIALLQRASTVPVERATRRENACSR